MKNFNKRLLCVVLFAGVLAVAQDKPAAPKLKDSVLNPLVELQNQELRLQIQYRNVDDALKAKQVTALKDSGIDETKWRLDPNTFEVVAVEQK